MYNGSQVVAAAEGEEGEAPAAPAKKKHTPLHWAAFKGDEKIVWLLLKEGLSPHDKDGLGNTVLHQAAAGGTLSMIETLLMQGVSVMAKNDRGHTAYDLCTSVDIKNAIQDATSYIECCATGKQFSGTVHRYLCSHNRKYYCDAAVEQGFYFETPQSEIKEKPITFCHEVRELIATAEKGLTEAQEMKTKNKDEHFTAVKDSLNAAENIPVDCKILDASQKLRSKLEAEIHLKDVITLPEKIDGTEEYKHTNQVITEAMEDAIAKGAEKKLITEAKNVRRRLLAEMSLFITLTQPPKTSETYIALMEELAKTATNEKANGDIIASAHILINQLKSERALKFKMADSAPMLHVVNIQEVFDEEAVKKLKLPDWAVDTPMFEEFHDDFKNVLATAEDNKIDEAVLVSATERLEMLEGLLCEKRICDDENKIRALKGKKKK